MSCEVPVEPADTTISWSERAWYGALAVSAIFHISAVVIGSMLPMTSRPPETRHGEVDSRWISNEIPNEPATLEPVVEISRATAAIEAPAPGGSSRESAVLLSETPGIPVIPQAPALSVNERPNSLTARMFELSRRDDLAKVIAPVTSGSGNSSGHGNGRGTGIGDGIGAGGGGRFFEMKAEGRRFVFVVDCSRSMNHPYPGEFKTRLNRVKMEIGRTILGMEDEAEYFIIFFNDAAHPMPAQTFQQAKSGSRLKNFEWLAAVPADGVTDPRPALSMALKMRPDVIYFLTDGEFTKPISRDLEKLVQRDVAIHTFSMSNPNAEETLKAVAEHNRGLYTFVP